MLCHLSCSPFTPLPPIPRRFTCAVGVSDDIRVCVCVCDVEGGLPAVDPAAEASAPLFLGKGVVTAQTVHALHEQWFMQNAMGLPG